MRTRLKAFFVFAVLLGISLMNYQSNASECHWNPRDADGQCITIGDVHVCIEPYNPNDPNDCIVD